METFKKHGVYEKVPIEECWKETGKAHVRVKWVDTNKGGTEKPEYRCRLVAKEIEKDKREDMFAATPPLEAKKMLFSLWASVPGLRLEFADVVPEVHPDLNLRSGQIWPYFEKADFAIAGPICNFVV